MNKKASIQSNEKNYVDVDSLDNIKQEARLNLIIDDIVAGLSKNAIITKYMDQWNISRATMDSIFKMSVLRLNNQNKLSKEEIREVNNIRLENVWSEAQTINQKLKTIDMINKTNNLYDNNVVVSADDSFHFDIGVEGTEKEDFYEEDQDDQE